MLSTQKQDSSELLQEHLQKATRTLSYQLKRTQFTQTVLLQKTETFGGKESDTQLKVTWLTGKVRLAQHSKKTKLLREKKWHIQTLALQLQLVSVHVSHLTGNLQKVFLFLLSSLVDAVHQQFHWYTRLVHGNTVYSLDLS